jgi:hypothetical protein
MAIDGLTIHNNTDEFRLVLICAPTGRVLMKAFVHPQTHQPQYIRDEPADYSSPACRSGLYIWSSPTPQTDFPDDIVFEHAEGVVVHKHMRTLTS